MDESAAYAIATAWHCALQGRVKLLHSLNTYTHIPEYDCVQFDYFGGRFLGASHAVLVTKCLRYSAIVWRRLSQCDGYRADQSPVFWKGVFSDLSLPSDSSSSSTEEASYYTPVSDVYRFFASCSDEFPRIRLRVGPDGNPPQCRNIKTLLLEEIEAIVREFGGVSSTSATPTDEDRAVEAQFREIMQTLDQYACRAHEPAKIDISFTGIDASTVGILESLCSREVSQVKCTPVPFATSISLGVSEPNGFRSLAGVDEPVCRERWPLRIRFVPRPEVNEQFHALMSALPFSTRISSIQMTSFHANGTPTAAVDSAWLGFAMFHPSAATSRWRQLALQVNQAELDPVALSNMANGNNIHHAVDNSTDLSTAYYFAVLNEDGVVHLKPSASSAQAITLPAGSLVDIYGATSSDLDACVDPISVIVPGIGLGLIEKRHIDRIESLPPSDGAQLTHLLCEYPHDPTFCTIFLPHFTATLTFLGLEQCGSFNVDEVSQILLSCSKLQELSISHDGSVWRESTPDQLSRMVRLKSLSLLLEENQREYFAPSSHALTTALCKLEDLHIISLRAQFLEVPDPPGSTVFDLSLDAIRFVLLNTGRLQYFYWYSQGNQTTRVRQPDSIKPTKPYEDLRQKQIAELGVSDDELVRIVNTPRPFPVLSRVATISVVCHPNAVYRAHAQLNRGILERIFEFACGVYQREISIRT